MTGTEVADRQWSALGRYLTGEQWHTRLFREPPPIPPDDHDDQQEDTA